MFDKRLLAFASDAKKYIASSVGLQWLALLGNVALIAALGLFLQQVLGVVVYGKGSIEAWMVGAVAGVAVASIVLRMVCIAYAQRMGAKAANIAKTTIRQAVYDKLVALGPGYTRHVATSEAVQVSVDGAEQLEVYYGSYLPQFFYALLAPITLFGCLVWFSPIPALVLLVCVPLIPFSIAAFQTIAKRVMKGYWGSYLDLGASFLENLQGLTTLKIYSADERRHEIMNTEAETFRQATMRLLRMQLNSITIMDLVAYGGAALGVIMAVTQLQKGQVTLAGAMLIILLSADFFIPMRMLGSYFHIAMNGMAAADKIFALLDLPEDAPKEKLVPKDCSIQCKDLNFSYDGDRTILDHVSMNFPQNSFTALVGESGCGKSTMSALLMGRNKGYQGSLTVGGIPLNEISEADLMKKFTYINHQSYLFKGTVRDNLLMGNPSATDAQMEQVLRQVNLLDFLSGEQGLDTPLMEKGSNFSGGQCQRLALARALLHDSPVYIFDEATSNIDVESENDIMSQIYALAKEKTVILISHRLANVVHADNIYVMDKGRVMEQGSHQELLNQKGTYARLWNAQQELEQFVGEGE